MSKIPRLRGRLHKGELITKVEAMDFLMKRCQIIGDCIVYNGGAISSTIAGKQFKCSTAVRLYYYLTKGEYPKYLKATCKTKNCIKHRENCSFVKHKAFRAVRRWTETMEVEQVPLSKMNMSFSDWLLCAIIKSAIEENDVDYFKGKVFQQHCKQYDVNPNQVLTRLPNEMRSRL